MTTHHRGPLAHEQNSIFKTQQHTIDEPREPKQ